MNIRNRRLLSKVIVYDLIFPHKSRGTHKENFEKLFQMNFNIVERLKQFTA